MTRHGMSAIELIVVLSVALLLSAMVVPGTLSALRRNAVRDGATSVIDVWRQAQTRAQRENPDTSSSTHAHYGVILVQRGGRAWVSMIYDNKDSAALIATPTAAAQHVAADGSIGTDTSRDYVLKYELPASVVIAEQDAGGTWRVQDGVWAWYAQYRTGLPVNPMDVAAGNGAIAAPFGVGVAEPPEIAAAAGVSAPVLCRGLRVQTHDYNGDNGHAAAVAIYHAGMAFMDQP
ncbi:MAG: type II secretion system protein [Planctomycetota bacterium]|jgi:type II secretory pathway pseudopilin PulG|nr:type II secretion system protein [Planctomycetota bacterium]